MAKQIKTIQDHLNAAGQWIEQETGRPIAKADLEQYFNERIRQMQHAHIAARFESYDIGDCLKALEIIGRPVKSSKPLL